MTTTQTLLTRDQRARSTVEAVVRRMLRSPEPVEIVVSARDNHSDEPSLYVRITMPDEESIPDIAMQNRLTSDLMSSLLEVDDERFAYVFYGPWSDKLTFQKRAET